MPIVPLISKVIGLHTSLFPLPLLMLRIILADDVHPPFPLHTLFHTQQCQPLSFTQPHTIEPPQKSGIGEGWRRTSRGRGNGRKRDIRTMHPSHSFLTELRVFMPLVCVCNCDCICAWACNCEDVRRAGLRRVPAVRHLRKDV